MALQKNVIANFSGSIWAALMSLAFVPFYIKLMGVESYGIVGVYVSLIGILSVLDLGLSQAMNREMARLSYENKNAARLVSTAHTLEILYWCIAVLIGCIVALLAEPIAKYWLNPETLTGNELRFAIQIMGLVIALRWPVAFYMGGLNGLQRQIHVNVVLSIFATIQGVGALAVLWFIEPSIQAFFMWQAVIALLQVITLRAVLWGNLPVKQKRVFDKKVLHEMWRFAAGMSGISLLATILTQLDKVVLSKMLTLTEFGYYTFAAAVAGVVFRLIGPVFTAYYPRLTELVAQENNQLLIKTYHQGSQLMAATILPVAIVLFFFSAEILDIWTRDPNLVIHTSALISLLAIGNALNGIMHLPYALQLAHGWTKLAFLQNIVAVIVLAPAIYFATSRWGAIGAAAVWIALNASYLLIGNHIMHLRLLPGEKWQWYTNDVIKPLLSAIMFCWFAKLIFVDELSFWIKIIALGLVLIGSLIVTVASSSLIRSTALRYLSKAVAK